MIEEGINFSKDFENESYMNIPKKKGVLILFLLSLITLKIYPCFWYIKRSDELNNLRTKSKLSKIWAILNLVFYLISIFLIITIFVFISINNKSLPQSSDITNLNDVPASFIILFTSIISVNIIILFIYLLMAFKSRKILNEAISNKLNSNMIKISAFYTLIFNFFYLQYEINRIIDDKEDMPRKAPIIALMLIIIFLVIIIGSAIILNYY